MDYNSNFQYAWRFIDENYNKLPIYDLNQIKEITEQESKILWKEYIQDRILYYPISDLIKNYEIKIKDCGWGNESVEEKTKDIISDLFKNSNKMLLFWGPNYAIKTKCSIFIKYWSDFCYCSDSGNIIYLFSDDIFIYYEDILMKAKIS